MHGFRRTQSLDRRDLVSIVHDSKVETREHAPAVHVHGACTALSVIAALLGAGQCQRLAETIQQGGARIDPQRMVPAVDAKSDRNGPFNGRRRRRFFCGCGGHHAITSASSIRLPNGSAKNASLRLMAGKTNGSVTTATPRDRSVAIVASTLVTFRQKWW